MFSTPKGSMKSKCNVFSGFKQTKDVCLEYLECKLQKVENGRCILTFKWHKTVEKRYL